MAQEHLFLTPYGTKIQTPAVVFETIFRAEAAGHLHAGAPDSIYYAVNSMRAVL